MDAIQKFGIGLISLTTFLIFLFRLIVVDKYIPAPSFIINWLSAYSITFSIVGATGVTLIFRPLIMYRFWLIITIFITFFILFEYFSGALLGV
jgi:hypothetical protein